MQGKQLDVNAVLDEYKRRLAEEMNSNIMLSVYVSELQARVAELEAKLADESNK